MKKNFSEIRRDLITACRILSREGLVQGFGHMSARIPGSELFLITPRASLALVIEKNLLVVNLKGETVEGKSPAPFEAPLHAAIFNARAEVHAVARVHARRAGYFSVTDKTIDPVHNHGSFFSGGVPVFPRTDLISTPKLGAEVAAALKDKPAILLRGNGQVAVGRTIPEAVVMAIYLEEAADMLYGALKIGNPIFLSREECASRTSETLPPVDLERAWKFFKSKIGSRSTKATR